jgi:uncharacterized repeat protein (TIGR03803 family)
MQLIQTSKPMSLHSVRILIFSAFVGLGIGRVSTTNAREQVLGSANAKILYSFCKQANCSDGQAPFGLVFDGNGNLSGTTVFGGDNDSGAIFTLKRNPDTGKWKYQVVYSLCGEPDCADGQYPYGKLIADVAGNLYGTTARGGVHGQGAVFELTPNSNSWDYKVVYSFCSKSGCRDGKGPQTGLTYAGAASGALYDGTSPLYGVTHDGGKYGSGTAYEITPATWKQTTIHAFCRKMSSCPDGELPTGLVADSAGNLFGITNLGGVLDGVLFELSPTPAQRTWRLSVLHKFCKKVPCDDGSLPLALALDTAGNVVGTTFSGGSTRGGVLFRLVPNGEHSKYSVLYSFCAQKNCRDGLVASALTVNSSGDIVGVTQFGGGHNIDRQGYGGGTVFTLSGSEFRTIYRFCAKESCSDGEYPAAGVTTDMTGKVFVTTGEGGKSGGGTLMELSR